MKFTRRILQRFLSAVKSIYNARHFKEKLYNIVEKERDIIVDLGELNYIDSTGLGIFVGALKKARLNGRNICIENTKDNIKNYLLSPVGQAFMI